MISDLGRALLRRQPEARLGRSGARGARCTITSRPPCSHFIKPSPLEVPAGSRHVLQRKFQTFLAERHVPVARFTGLPAPRPPGKQTSAAGGHAGDPAAPAKGSAPSAARARRERGANRNLPALTHAAAPGAGGGAAAGDSRKSAPPGLGGRRGAGPRAHSPRGRSWPLFRRAAPRARARRPARGSRRSPRAGSPCLSRREPRERGPAGLHRGHRPGPARLPHLLSARTRVPTASVPDAAFVSSASEPLTAGSGVRGRTTAGGAFSPPPGLGEGCGGLGSAPRFLRPVQRRSARAGQERPPSEIGSACPARAPPP